MAAQHEIIAVLADAIDTGAMHMLAPKERATNAVCNRFRAKFRAALAELPSDAMVCEVLEVMDRGG